MKPASNVVVGFCFLFSLYFVTSSEAPAPVSEMTAVSFILHQKFLALLLLCSSSALTGCKRNVF